MAREVPAGDACVTGRRLGCGGTYTKLLLNRLGKAGKIDWTRASLDSASIPAKKGAKSWQESNR